MTDAFTNVMKDKTNYFTSLQVDRMLNNCDNEKQWLLIFLLWRTGRRVSEVLKIKPKDIDYDNNLIFCHILKKRKPVKEWKAVDQKTLEALKYHIMYYGIPSEDYIFESTKLNSKGEISHYTRKWAFEQVRKITKKCDIIYKNSKKELEIMRNGKIVVLKSGWHPHHFRHSFSINFLKKAKTQTALSILQNQLSHSSIKVTQEYLQFSQEERVKLLNQVFNEKNESNELSNE